MFYNILFQKRRRLLELQGLWENSHRKTGERKHEAACRNSLGGDPAHLHHLWQDLQEQEQPTHPYLHEAQVWLWLHQFQFGRLQVNLMLCSENTLHYFNKRELLDKTWTFLVRRNILLSNISSNIHELLYIYLAINIAQVNSRRHKCHNSSSNCQSVYGYYSIKSKGRPD